MRARLGIVLATLLCASGAVTAVARAAAADTSVPSLTVGDVSVWEGNAGSLVVKVPVDLSIVPTSPVTVSYSVSSDGSPDSATSGDFVAHKGKLNFKAGSVPSKSVTVKVDGDTVDEPDEHVLVHVTSITGADLAKGDGGVTILNDDDGVSGSGVTVGIGDVSVVEADAGRHIASLPVTLSVPAPTKIQVAYSVECATADQTPDYTTKSRGTITFLANQQTKYIQFQIAADTVPEAFVTQVIDSISVVTGPAAVRTTASSGDTTITDNDAAAPPTSPPPPGPDSLGNIQRVSVATDGEEAEKPPAGVCDQISAPSGIWGSQISRNGRYVAFASAASNLVSDDTNGIMDVFVRDLQTQTTERVSLQPDGTEFHSSNVWGGGSSAPAISADGRYVTFYNGGNSELYVRDRVAGTTQQISVTGVGGSGQSSISDDGRYVTYASYGSQGLPLGTIPTGQDAVFLWDRASGTTSLIAVRSPDSVDGFSYDWGNPVISGNGRYLAFTDGLSGLVPGDTNNCADTFVRDLQTGQTERVSVTSAGGQQVTQWEVSCSYGSPAISDDGRFVGFSSSAWNLYPGATGSADLGSGAPALHAYLRDRLLGTTELVDTISAPDSEGRFNAVSDDGRYVAFSCFCGDPVPEVPTVNDNVSMWLDRQTGVMLEVGEQPDGTPPIDENTGWFTFDLASSMSGDGHTVAFTSSATNLVPTDANEMQDAFIQQFG